MATSSREEGKSTLTQKMGAPTRLAGSQPVLASLPIHNAGRHPHFQHAARRGEPEQAHRGALSPPTPPRGCGAVIRGTLAALAPGMHCQATPYPC